MAWMMCMDCGQRISCKKLDAHDLACKKKVDTRRFKNKPSIAELEALLNAEEMTPITILPNGQIVDAKYASAKSKKPLTYKENLGGEYAINF